MEWQTYGARYIKPEKANALRCNKCIKLGDSCVKS